MFSCRHGVAFTKKRILRKSVEQKSTRAKMSKKEKTLCTRDLPKHTDRAWNNRGINLWPQQCPTQTMQCVNPCKEMSLVALPLPRPRNISTNQIFDSCQCQCQFQQGKAMPMVDSGNAAGNHNGNQKHRRQLPWPSKKFENGVLPQYCRNAGHKKLWLGGCIRQCLNFSKDGKKVFD